MLAARRGLRRQAGGRPHAADPADLSVPRAKRRLGQHFLTDPRILGRIADALEAGPQRHGARDRSGTRRAHRARSRRAPGGSSPSRRIADLVPALRARFPGRGDRRGRRARARLARARGPRDFWSPATFPTTSPRLSSTRRCSHPGPRGSSSWCRRRWPTGSRRRRGQRIRSADSRGAGRGPGASGCLHRSGRRVPAATQGGFGGASTDAAGAAAGVATSAECVQAAGRGLVRLPAETVAAGSAGAHRLGRRSERSQRWREPALDPVARPETVAPAGYVGAARRRSLTGGGHAE